MRRVVLVSACLLGVPCNDRGRANPAPIGAALAGAEVISVCPEVMGGLSVPRPAAEIGPDGQVVNRAGRDVTAAYRRGAEAVVSLAQTAGASEAILKARSPACGCREIYDGSFTRTLVPGQGVAAAALEAAGLVVRSDEETAAP